MLLRNNSIRLKIVNLFELRYKYIAGLYNSESSVNEVIRPYYLDNFTNLEFTKSADPIDFRKVWKDPKYKNIVHYRIINLKSNHLKSYPATIKEIEILVDEIQAYLN